MALRTLSAGALLAMGFWPGTVLARKGGAGGAAFKFVTVNDTHHLSPECEDWFALMVDRLNQEKPAFCLHLGDLTEKGQRSHLRAVKRAFHKLDAPFYPVIGNHDYLTKSDRRAYVDMFPLRLNYYFRHAGWQFVGLDTTQGTDYEKTRIHPATFRMAKDILRRLDPEQPTVIFTHFPMGEGVKYRPANADELLDLFRKFNLRAVFSGHFHSHTEVKAGSMLLTTGKCCALRRTNHDKTKEKGFYVCEVAGGQISRRFVEIPVPAALQKAVQANPVN